MSRVTAQQVWAPGSCAAMPILTRLLLTLQVLVHDKFHVTLQLQVQALTDRCIVQGPKIIEQWNRLLAFRYLLHNLRK